jgi:hypothetical protein
MSKSSTDSRMTEAWLLAWQLRCCPPDAVLAGELSDELRQHLDLCPLCRREHAEALPSIRLNLPADSLTDQQQPRPGELWSLQPSLGGWGPKQRYYNPPLVLITAVEGKDNVHLVQTFGNVDFAGPDDLLFDNGLSGFIEPWNQYTLQRTALQTCLGQVSTQLLSRLQERIDSDPSSPEPGSLLWFFRQMEVETGWYFAAQSLAAHLTTAEKPSPFLLAGITTDTLLADLGNLSVIIPHTDPAALPEDILAQTMPADDLLPMAAAELQPQAIQILLFTVEQDRIQKVELIPAEVTVIDRQESTLYVSGCCSSDVPDNAAWIFRWQSAANAVKPLPGRHGASKGVFWTVFPIADIPDPEQGELIVRIVIQR